MARTKKRAAPTAASERSSKKRKSAEAGMAKMKEIADAEEAFSEDEQLQIEALSKEADEGENSEGEDNGVEGMAEEALDAGPGMPVVAPGFRLWETKSRLVTKGESGEVSKYDETKDEYTHLLKIKYSEAFKLVPLTITQGPYQGRQVFMLEPQTGFFRFMDLPPEIRNMVYACLFEADDTIEITSRKPTNAPRRPVAMSSRGKHVGDRYIIEERIMPEGIQLLRTSKQLFQEAAPVLYGTNRYKFHGMDDMKVFLGAIGSMRPYLRHLALRSNGWWRNKARPTFHLLKDATELRTLTFPHSDVEKVLSPSRPYYLDRWITNPAGLAQEIRVALKSLHQLHISTDSVINVLDIVKLDWTRCSTCEDRKPSFAPSSICKDQGSRFSWREGEPKVRCADAEEHCREIEREVRIRLANILGIDDGETMGAGGAKA